MHRSPKLLLGSLLVSLTWLPTSAHSQAAATPPEPAATVQPTASISPDTTDPKVIMEAVESRLRADRTKARTILRITDGSGRVRERVVRSWGMDRPDGELQLMIFESPADVRNTGLLSVDHKDGNKDDDQWLYLPSLKKATRISSGDKSGSFMGTDLTYADMTRADPAHYQYKLLKQSVQVGGEDCWLIGAKPITAKAKEETGYLKTMVWVSKSKLVTLQVKAWVIEGKRTSTSNSGTSSSSMDGGQLTKSALEPFEVRRWSQPL